MVPAYRPQMIVARYFSTIMPKHAKNFLFNPLTSGREFFFSDRDYNVVFTSIQQLEKNECLNFLPSNGTFTSLHQPLGFGSSKQLNLSI